MPSPILLSPIARIALRYGVVAVVALVAARNRASEPKDPTHEAVLDGLPEGLRAAPHRAEAESALHGNGRLRRVFRLRRDGPGFEVDAAGLARLRFRRVE